MARCADWFKQRGLYGLYAAVYRSFSFLEDPDSMYNTPDVANQEDGEKKLQDSEQESSRIEFAGACTCRHHGAHSTKEGNAVQNKTDSGCRLVELDH